MHPSVETPRCLASAAGDLASTQGKEVSPLIIQVAETPRTIPTPTIIPGVQLQFDLMMTDASQMSCTCYLGCVPAP